MNILILMAGRGKRIQDYFNCPKPLVQIRNQFLVEISINSLGIEGNYIFLVRKFDEFGEKNEEYNNKLEDILLNIKPNSKLIYTDVITDGAACSALLAKEYINNDEQLIITNCDQKLDWSGSNFVDFINETNSDGTVTTYPHSGIVLNRISPYSFIKLNDDGWATKLEEKFAISEYALNGIHYWKYGKYFVQSAEKMIKQNDRCNNEFYISKAYNYLLDKKINIYSMKKKEFISLGTTEEIIDYGYL